jgi:RNA-directed DNA polymerase
MNHANHNIVQHLASEAVLEQAFQAVCLARVLRDADDDIWHLRFHWPRMKAEMQAALLAGQYRFSPCLRVAMQGTCMGLWNAQDAVVQKAMVLVLHPLLLPAISNTCYHVAGRGGAKAAVRQAAGQAGEYPFVMKSDVRSYYASIDHAILIAQLRSLIVDERMLDLLLQYLDHLNDVDGELFAVEQGIAKGSSLSPLLGALYLQMLDSALVAHASRHGLVYMRFMDDWLLLCKTRRQLRTGVRIMNQVLALLKLDKAPDKTFIGKLDKGIDFLGYHFGNCIREGVSIAKKTWINHQDKLARLYEQGAGKTVLREYERKWRIWARSGVQLMTGWDEGCWGDVWVDVPV